MTGVIGAEVWRCGGVLGGHLPELYLFTPLQLYTSTALLQDSTPLQGNQALARADADGLSA